MATKRTRLAMRRKGQASHKRRIAENVNVNVGKTRSSRWPMTEAEVLAVSPEERLLRAIFGKGYARCRPAEFR